MFRLSRMCSDFDETYPAEKTFFGELNVNKM